MRFAFVDSEWFQAQVAARASTRKSEKQMLVMGAEEQALGLAADERAHGEVSTLVRAR